MTQTAPPLLRVLDLFCGIGSFTWAALRYPTVFVAVSGLDNDREVAQTYSNTYGLASLWGNIQEFDCTHPDFQKYEADVVTAGFPCQPFSGAGHRAGFLDTTNGDLIFYTAEIVKKMKPAYVVLENVTGVLTLDGGETHTTITNLFIDAGYQITWVTMNAKECGIPQDRKRAFAFCQRRDTAVSQCCVLGILKRILEDRKSIPLPSLSDFLGIPPLEAVISHTVRIGGFHTHIDHPRNWTEYRFQGTQDVYKLTLTDCAKLQGFEENKIMWADTMSTTGKRKAIGNSIPTVLTCVMMELVAGVEHIRQQNRGWGFSPTMCTGCKFDPLPHSPQPQ